ncbi:protein phosphatase 2C domain-containing protein (plasmid) [Lysinibacillus capsici]|uniref:PP2C family serine/threonine-protein phosphatase n=1 Tax=Lysinibacillus capsici TaxID=2115968 RepID=UPI0021D9D244|nr:PP2C family serine/threonine-protein phosphatase [Lysinibacillus capsici]UYB50064.1 protein phosphatase 2C domain-containing protein [Lysinibacillus capsici]
MWKMVGTSVQGRSHIKNNIPVQDQIFYKKGTVNIIALADGAGSSKLSHFGAQTVVESICDLLYEQFDYFYELHNVEMAQQLVLSKLLENLHQLANLHNEELKEFASTLLCVAIKDEKILIFHLGDGEIGAIKHNEIVSLSSGMNSEFANATYFVTSSNAVNKLKLFKSKNDGKFSSFFLMSDGSAMSLYSKRTQSFSQVIKNICTQSKVISEQSMNEMLEESFTQFVRMKTLDDCSFVAMTHVKSPNNPYESLSQLDKQFLLEGFSEKKHCSVNKMDKIIAQLTEPLTVNTLAKCLHINKKYLKSTVNILKALQIIQQKNQFYIIRNGVKE